MLKTTINFILTGVILVVTPSSLFSQAGWSGTYSGNIDGAASTMTIQQNGNSISGNINSGGYQYGLQGTVSGQNSQGQIQDLQTQALMDYQAILQGNNLGLTVIVVDPYTFASQSFQYQFTKGGGGIGGPGGPHSQSQKKSSSSPQPVVQPGSPNNAGQNMERDQNLVGSWIYSNTYISGDFGTTTEVRMQINSDGTYLYGDSQVFGGGPAGSFNSGGGGDMTRGQWQTRNGVIFINEGYGWEEYSGYYVEGNSMLLKFSDGSKQLWERTY